MTPPAANITDLLREIRQGRRSSVDRLMNVVYNDLGNVARKYMGGERQDHTLQPTAVVHEAYMRIFEGTGIEWQDRAHFFAVAAGQMRRVLQDHGRAHRAAKRGSGLKVMLDDALSASPVAPCEFTVLDELLDRLQKSDPKAAQVIELKFFAGLSDREVAEVTRQSHMAVRRHWMFARAWMARELTSS